MNFNIKKKKKDNIHCHNIFGSKGEHDKNRIVPVNLLFRGEWKTRAY